MLADDPTPDQRTPPDPVRRTYGKFLCLTVVIATSDSDTPAARTVTLLWEHSPDRDEPTTLLQAAEDLADRLGAPPPTEPDHRHMLIAHDYLDPGRIHVIPLANIRNAWLTERTTRP